MKSPLVLGLLALFWLLCVSFSSQAGQKEAVQLTSVQAEFVQEKHLKILTRPLISKGSFTFQSPQSLRWEYRSPVASLLLMHGDTIRKFIKKDGAWREEKGARFDFMQVVMAEIGNWLDGRFTDNEMFNVTFPNNNMVYLIPKSEGLAQYISKIELQLAHEKGLLDGVKIYEEQESYTQITFTERILNREIPAHQFTQQ